MDIRHKGLASQINHSKRPPPKIAMLPIKKHDNDDIILTP